MPQFVDPSNGNCSFISAAALANPAAFGINLDNMSAVYVDSSGVRYQSNGSALVNVAAFTGGTVSLTSNVAESRNLGVSSGTVIPWQFSFTGSGDAGATADVRNILNTFSFTGANGASQLYGNQIQMEIPTTGGTVASAYAYTAYLRLGLGGAVSGTLSSGAVFEGHIAHEGTTGALTSAAVFRASSVDLADGTGPVGSIYGKLIGDLGHASRISGFAAGIRCGDFTGGAAISAAMVSQITAGTNKWNFYSDGTANNCFAGNAKFGAATVPTASVDIAAGTTAKAQIRLVAGVAPSAPNDGDIWFTGTVMQIRVAGVTRTFTVT